MCIGSGICLLSMLSACTARDLSPEEQAARDQAAHIEQVVAAGGTVDSILPTEELLRRFREDLPPVDTLRAASESMEALVARLAHAVGTNDTTDLNAMVLSRQEFAYLYYPDAPLSQPPYDSPPALLW